MKVIIFKKDCGQDYYGDPLYKSGELKASPKKWIWEDEYKDCWDYASAQDIWDYMDKIGQWDDDLCRALCEMAGLEDEWDASDAESFEGVIYKAAEKLGIKDESMED